MDPKDPATLELIKRLQNSSRFNIQGIYSHSGNSYNCKCAEGDDGIEGVKKAARSVATEEADVLSGGCLSLQCFWDMPLAKTYGTTEFHKLLASEGIEVPVVSIGSTPSCSTVEACGSCNEVTEACYSTMVHPLPSVTLYLHRFIPGITVSTIDNKWHQALAALKMLPVMYWPGS